MAMLATVFIVMVIIPSSAFVVDLGVMQWQRSRAQRAVDSAALAAIKEYIKKSQSDSDAIFASRAKDIAITFANQNGSDVTTVTTVSSYEYRITGAKDTLTVKSGRYDVSTKVFSTGTTPINAIEVGISRSVPLYFGRIFGLTKSTVAVTALARIGPATQGSYPGVLPIGVPNADYNPAQLYTIKGINWGSVAPGYKGILNLDKRWWHCAFYSTTNSRWYSLYDYDADGNLVSRVDYTGDGGYDSPACNGSNFSYLDIDNDGTQDWNGDVSNAIALQQILNAGEDSGNCNNNDCHRGQVVVDASSVPAGCSEPLNQDYHNHHHLYNQPEKLSYHLHHNHIKNTICYW
ncbi:pilus assembly protein TadG-related protein [Patescibacteria group bacterium]|nr:pilus assembly protein TadG-related protein [Patescibacteria group bacterium]